ncbi:hypothetical protein NG798_25300 [Ancylothrix sp. C2]|uniref:hypothetical protein n=1 Tax=Ancylothrix sp. D3o TaxID=2953691 RepID=UPI0021BB961B|nr:hypothetical protein [Ancylothrix sp. D3o]MCT7953119.1 hypothetical protein [Ancylothrix sp. D3o]
MTLEQAFISSPFDIFKTLFLLILIKQLTLKLLGFIGRGRLLQCRWICREPVDEVRQANFRGRWYFKGRWNSLVPVKLPTPMELRSDGGTPGLGVRQANTWGPMDVRGLGGVRKLVDVKMPVDWVG